MKKPWFTLIEILFVLIIIGITFLMGRPFFDLKNKDIFYGQNCLESLYGDISTFANNAITSKWIRTGGQVVYPSQYHILIKPSTNSIILSYTSGSSVYTASLLALTGQLPWAYYCKKSNYLMTLSGGNDLKISINKSLAQDQNFQSFILSWGNFTGSIELRQKSIPAGSPDKLIGTITVDTRTQSIQRKICLNISPQWDCLERNK